MFCPRCTIQLEAGCCPDCGEQAPYLRVRGIVRLRSDGGSFEDCSPERPRSNPMRESNGTIKPPPDDEGTHHWDSGLD